MITFVDDSESYIGLLEEIFDYRKDFKYYTNPCNLVLDLDNGKLQTKNIISDYNMPGMDGIILASYIAENHQNINIYIHSSCYRDTFSNELESGLIKGCKRKDYSLSSIESLVNKILDKEE